MIRTSLPKSYFVYDVLQEFYTTYGRRWYVVGLFAFFELHQCLVWNVFGPIAFTVKAAYGWSDGTLAMMLNWGCIMFLFCLVPLTRYCSVVVCGVIKHVHDT